MRTNDGNVYEVTQHDAPPDEWFGHASVPKEAVTITYSCEDCGRVVAKLPDGSFRHVPRGEYLRSSGDWGTWAKERRKAAQERRKAEAKPYTGAIEQCQVGMTTNDRASIHYRCEKPARFVVRDSLGEPMVVCATHVRSRTNSRYRGQSWPKSEGANEPIEEEYL